MAEVALVEEKNIPFEPNELFSRFKYSLQHSGGSLSAEGAALKALEARGQKKKQQQEQEAAQQLQQEEAQRQAERAKVPDNVLATAYASYIDVKRCYEACESYAVGYISYEEMELAKSAVHKSRKR